MDKIFSFGSQKRFNAKFGRECSIASRWNKGFKITRSKKLTRKHSFEHLMVIAPTGAGKSTKILLPLLLELKNCSIVINDPDRFIFNNFSAFLQKRFPTIKLLNFSSPLDSSGYNLFANIRNDADSLKLAELLTKSKLGNNSADPFWYISAINLIHVFNRLVMHQPIEYRHPAQVLYLLKCFAAHPQMIDQLIINCNSEKLTLDYKAVISNSEKTLQSIVSTALSIMQIFDNEDIAKITSHHSIDFEILRKKPSIIFLHNSISDMEFTNALNGVFFTQLFSKVMSKLPEKDDLDLFVILEEASSMFINQLPTALANLRKFRCGTVICCQSTNQLKTMYKEEAENIKSNAVTKLFLPGLSNVGEMREIEELAGTTTYTDKSGIEKSKKLISVPEIRQLSKNKSLILSGSHPLIKGRTRPYYKSLRYRYYASQGAVTIKSDIPDQPLKFLK